MASVPPGRRLSEFLLQPFRVGGTSATEMPVIDGLRAVAVTMVLLLHSWGSVGAPDLHFTLPILGTRVWLSEWIHQGDLGVALFFILSGFLLPQPWFRAAYTGGPPPSLLSYFRRRILRIVPLYYACLFILLVFLTPTLIPAEWVYSWAGLRELVTHLTFTHFWFIETGSSWGVDGPMWTLTHEATFYVLLPFTAFLFAGRRALFALPAALGITVAWAVLATHNLGYLVDLAHSRVANEPYFNDANIRQGYLLPQFPGHVFNFALGMALASLFVACQTKQIRAPGPLAALAMLAAGTALLLGAVHYVDFQHPDVSLYFIHIGTPMESAGLALVMGGLVFGAPLATQILSAAPIRIVGIVSYSLFLWHVPMLYVLNRIPNIAEREPGDRLVTVLLWATPLILTMSIGSYLLIERPFLLMARSRRTVPARQPAAVAAAAVPLRPPTIVPPPVETPVIAAAGVEAEPSP